MCSTAKSKRANHVVSIGHQGASTVRLGAHGRDRYASCPLQVCNQRFTRAKSLTQAQFYRLVRKGVIHLLPVARYARPGISEQRPETRDSATGKPGRRK